MPHLLDGGGGVGATTVQTTIGHFGEPMIAGKTHSEILSMKSSMRCRWYKTLLPEGKEEAMRTVETARRAKIRVSKIGENNPNFCGLSEEHKAKISVAMTGKPRSEKCKAKISASYIPERKAKYSAHMTGENNPMSRPEVRDKISGENNPNWQNGASFKPYCHLFNDRLKESIRNRDNRVCVLCGKGEIQNGQRLSVHHIDSDKAQGCQGKKWYLCALCRSCNSRPDTVEKEFLIVTGGRSGR